MAILLFVNLKGGVAKTAIDCPPNFPSQVRVWLSVGTGCIVPSVSDRLSVRGSRSLLDRIRTQGSSSWTRPSTSTSCSC